MKKLVMLALSVILVQGLMVSAPAPKTEANAWQKLDRMRILPQVNIYKEKIQKVKLRYEKPVVVDLRTIREAMETAGIDETVTIEVRFNHKLITSLGTYTPTVTMMNGKKVVSFDSMPAGRRVYRSLTRLSPDYYNALEEDSPEPVAFKPHHLKLYFKNKTNKTKAQLCVKFFYI